MAGLGLTNYRIKDPFNNFIDLSYVFVGITGATGTFVQTNYTSIGKDIGRFFQPIAQIINTTGSIVLNPFPTYDASFAYYEFTVGTTIQLTNCAGVQFYYLAVGGGGGGGCGATTSTGGGGGAGGMVQGSLSLISDSITITIGTGGTAGISGTRGGIGGSTTISGSSITTVSAGGGGGGGIQVN
jgi:hypothetical protein